MRGNGPSWMVTGCGALLLGIAIGVWLIPAWTRSSQLEAIASKSVESRSLAWTWWNTAEDGVEPRAAVQLDEINDVLQEAPDEALLHAADQLRRMGYWGWRTQPPELISRHLRVLIRRGHVLDLEDVVQLIESAPLDAAAHHVIDPTVTLLEHGDPYTAAATFESLAAWAGIEPRLALVLDRLPEDRLEWGTPYRAWLEQGPAPIRIDVTTPYRSTDEDTEPDDQLVVQTLMLDEIDRRNTSLGRIAIRLDDPDPHRRQISALLAALRGDDGTAVAEAMLIERDPQTRLTMRLALDALDRPTTDDDPREFAWRAMQRTPDRLWHPPILTRLISGDPSLMGPLLRICIEDQSESRAVAWQLSHRFMPHWVVTAPEDAEEAIDVERFFPRLLARWHLERRRLERNESGMYEASGL